MDIEIKIALKESFVEVSYEGDAYPGFRNELFLKIASFCQENDCYNVLVIANTTKAATTMGAFLVAEVFHKLDIDQSYQLAWVELSPDRYEAAAFIEAVLKNRFLPGRFFKDIKEVKAWLLGEGNEEE